jgi:hypothetical protein
MAAITTAAAGNWSATGTWTGGVVPGNGDTVTLNHNVVVDATVTIGESGVAGITAILVKTGKSLTINATLYCRGNLTQERGSTVSVMGSTLFLDSATAGVSYRWIAVAAGTGVPKFEIKSVSGVRGTVNGSAGRGGDNGNMASNGDGNSYWLTIDFDGAILTNLGSSSVRAINSYMHDSTCHCSVKRTLFNGCGEPYFQINNGATNLVFDVVDVRNALAGTGLYLLGSQDKTTGQRLVRNLTLYNETGTKTFFNLARDMELENVVLHGYGFTNGAGTLRNTFDRLFLTKLAQPTSLQVLGKTGCTIKRSIFASAVGNPHVITDNNSDNGQADNVVEDCVADAWGYSVGDWGEFIANCAKRFVVRRNIVFNGSINLYSIATTTGTISAERNTVYNAYGMNIGETNANANALEKYTSNLMVSLPLGMAQLSAFASLNNATDIDHNGFWDMGTATNLAHPVIAGNPRSYMGAESRAGWFADGLGFNGAAGRGQGDVHANPNFVDPTRTVKKWGQLFDENIDTLQDMARFMCRINGYDYTGAPVEHDEDATIEACWTYVRDGFAPTNTAYKGTGEGGVDIGAMDHVITDATAPNLTDASCTATSPTTATGVVTTDDGNGTLYFRAYVGSAGAWSQGTALSQSVTIDGPQAVSLEGLDPSTDYVLVFQHRNGAGLDSELITTPIWTTPHIAIKGVTVALYTNATPITAVSDIIALWWDTPTPVGNPAYSTSTASINDGVLTLDISSATTLTYDAEGFLLLYKPNATDHKLALGFMSKIPVSDIG